LVDIFSFSRYNPFCADICARIVHQGREIMKKQAIRTAFLDTVPVMTGYLFLGFGFGILLDQNGFGPGWAVAMSLFIYAGSMQYVAIGLMTGGAGLLTTALTTLMVNARHLFYGISMVDAYRGAGTKKPYLIFALTDETYSLVSRAQTPDGLSRHSYCFLVSLFNQCYWVVGSALGSLAGQLIPINYEGIDFVLTALFVTIFVEQWLSARDHQPALVGLGASTVCLLIFGADLFLIPAMALIAGILTAMQGKEAAHG
jgi:4-azaleucine resistance transporter AzlC